MWKTCALAIGLAAGPAAAGPAETMAAAGIESGTAPGVVAASWRAGGEVALAVRGLRAVDGPQVRPGDAFHVGSNTKAMTATLVARMVEAGQVSWDDTVADHLGALIDEIDPALARADFRALLTHRSGLVANLGRLASLRLWGARAERDMIADRLRYAEAVLGKAPAVPPGEFLYSNAGYVVAGAMLEAAAGRPWEALRLVAWASFALGTLRWRVRRCERRVDAVAAQVEAARDRVALRDALRAVMAVRLDWNDAALADAASASSRPRLRW